MTERELQDWIGGCVSFEPLNPLCFKGHPNADPAVRVSLPDGENELAGEDFEATLAESSRNRSCAVCGIDLDWRTVPRSPFCSPRCRYRFRDRRKYAANPERERERSRAYYWRNREAVLEKAAAKRGRPRPPELTHCTECGDELKGRQRVICGKASCRDRRFKRTNPEAYAERERQKVERRRAARRAKREGSAT